jgi:hypothetical protein
MSGISTRGGAGGAITSTPPAIAAIGAILQEPNKRLVNRVFFMLSPG